MTDHAFFIGLRVRVTTTLNEETQNYVGGVSTKYSLWFCFLPVRSLDMACALTSDQQFSSPRFRPRYLNKGLLIEVSVTGYQRLDLQCWECVFRTHRGAQ